MTQKVSLSFANTRADRATGTVTYDVMLKMVWKEDGATMSPPEPRSAGLRLSARGFVSK
jgi:hypothetical protein